VITISQCTPIPDGRYEHHGNIATIRSMNASCAKKRKKMN